MQKLEHMSAWAKNQLTSRGRNYENPSVFFSILGWAVLVVQLERQLLGHPFGCWSSLQWEWVNGVDVCLLPIKEELKNLWKQ
jgi:hypothetical protein